MRSIVTVVGLDQVGIIAGVCNLLAEHNINVLDINQSILGEFFNMIMVVDIENSDIEFDDIAQNLNKLAEKLNVKIQIQHETIFQSMHRI